MAKKPPPEPPEPVDATEQLEKMVDVLAQVSATEQVMNHEQASRHVDELRRRVQSVVSTTKLKIDEETQRKKMVGEIDQLIDSVAQIQNDVGRAVAGKGDQLKAAVRADTIGKTADALRLISDWLSNPQPETRQRIEQLIASIRDVTGADPFLDDERAEAKRKAELEADVKKSLDEIFGDLKIKPPL